MSPPPRQLRFAVGSSLLTASLSLTTLAGCDDARSVDPKPDPGAEQQPEPEPTHTVNEGPEPKPEVEPPSQPPDPPYVNMVAEPEPRRVNLVAEPEPVPPGAGKPEPYAVNPSGIKDPSAEGPEPEPAPPPSPSAK